MDEATKNTIQEHIDNNDVCLFMKGTPDAPQCGFSMAVTNMLKLLELNFHSVNVLEDQNIICVHNKNWHPGVLGIVASKLTNKFMRPSIVISEDNKVCSASCRSVRSFDIGKFILDSVNNGILTSGGGHKMAGGFKIESSKIKDFKISLKNKFVTNIENLKKNYDFELKISTIDNQLFHKINNFSPFGIGNPKPKFIINDVVEKPKLSEAPSNYAIIGRYILPMKILSVLKNQGKGKGGEIHITDSIRRMILDQYLLAHKLFLLFLGLVL